MSTQIFEYEKFKITFENKDGNLMVNATEMAKPFNKRSNDFLSNNGVKEFMNTLAETRKSVLADLVIVANGGNNSGTLDARRCCYGICEMDPPKFASIHLKHT